MGGVCCRSSKRRFQFFLCFALSTIVLGSILVVPAALGDSFPITCPAILQLGDDATVSDGAANLAYYIGGVRISIVSVSQLEWVVRKAVDQVFYVGHGSPAGIVVGADLVSWAEFLNIVMHSPAKEHYFGACYSSLIGRQDSKMLVGFDGAVDVDVAVLLLAAVAYGARSQPDKLPVLASAFAEKHGLEKLQSPERPLFSITTATLPKTTPYGVTNPLAAQIVVTEAELTLYGPLTLAAMLIAALGGIAGLILGAYLAGFAMSLSLIWSHDPQGTYPNRYIIWWIPLDLYNLWLISKGFPFYFMTPHFWWGCFLSYAYIIGPA
jgi:hypothetical protein